MLRPNGGSFKRAIAALVFGFGLAGLPSGSFAADVSTDYALLKRSAHLGIWMSFMAEALERPAAISDASFRALANKICDRIEHDMPLVPITSIEKIRGALLASDVNNRSRLAAPFSVFSKEFVGAQAPPVARSIMLGAVSTQAVYNASILHEQSAAREFIKTILATTDLDPAFQTMHDLRTSLTEVAADDWKRQLVASDAIRRTISATEEAVTGAPAGILAILPIDPTGKDTKFRLKLEIAGDDGVITAIDSFSVTSAMNATHTLRCAVNQEPYIPARYAFPIIVPNKNDGERIVAVQKILGLCERANSNAIVSDGKNRAEDVILNLIETVAPGEAKRFTDYLERLHLTIKSD